MAVLNRLWATRDEPAGIRALASAIEELSALAVHDAIVDVHVAWELPLNVVDPSGGGRLAFVFILEASERNE